MDPLPRKPASARPPLSTRVGRACSSRKISCPSPPCRDRNLPFGSSSKETCFGASAPLNEGRARLLLPAKLPVRLPVPRQEPAVRILFQGNLLRRVRPSQRESGAPVSSRKTSRPPPCAETGTCLSEKEGVPLGSPSRETCFGASAPTRKTFRRPHTGAGTSFGKTLKKSKSGFAPFRVANPLLEVLFFLIPFRSRHSPFFRTFPAGGGNFPRSWQDSGETVRPHPCRPSGTC